MVPRHRRDRVLIDRIDHAADALLRVAEALASTSRHAVDERELDDLFTEVWARYGDRAWTVGELRKAGMVADDRGAAVGQALGALAKRGGELTSWRLERHDSANTGRIWRLVRRGSASRW